jgi:hypothetical protein
MVSSLKSNNWSALEKLKAVLPEDQDGVSGFSIIGNVKPVCLAEHVKLCFGSGFSVPVP